MANNVPYGFLNMQDLFEQRVTEIGVETVETAIQQSFEEHNRQINALTELFVERTTQWKLRYNTPQFTRNQPLDDNGRARPIKVSGKYEVGFPIYSSGSAYGFNYVTGQYATVGEIARVTDTIANGDARWMRDQILKSLFDNVGYNYTDDLYGTLAVKGLANGDSVEYQVLSGSELPATDTHYLAQAAGIADATNPYPTIYDELTEHPENGGDVIALIPTNLKATTEALANYRPLEDPNLTPSANRDVLSGSIGLNTPGRLLGYVNKVWIYEWRFLPSNYIVSLATSGAKALRMREDPISSLQGFNRKDDRDDYPYYEREYLRRAGFGAWNRVGAVVTRIGNGSYAIPTSYDDPGS